MQPFKIDNFLNEKQTDSSAFSILFQFENIVPLLLPHFHTYLSIYISIYLSIYVSIYLSMYLSIHITIYLSIYPYIYLSIYHLSESMFTDPLAKGQLSTHAPASGPTSVLTYLYTENEEK